MYRLRGLYPWKQTTRLILFYLLLISLSYSACLLPLPSSEEFKKVTLNKQEFDEYYRQFYGRFLLWEERLGIPKLVPADTQQVYISVGFFEFSATGNTTCYFKQPDVIQIGSDKWESGCVPHEIGHAALYLAKHPCWGEFEHDKEENKCKERFR